MQYIHEYVGAGEKEKIKTFLHDRLLREGK